eukprot:scaffold631_cov378-Prasinococcus_capsulatus_cf.AAC.13
MSVLRRRRRHHPRAAAHLVVTSHAQHAALAVHVDAAAGAVLQRLDRFAAAANDPADDVLRQRLVQVHWVRERLLRVRDTFLHDRVLLHRHLIVEAAIEHLHRTTDDPA